MGACYTTDCRYRSNVLQLAEYLSEATDQAIETCASIELQKRLAAAKVGVTPAVPSEDLTVMRQREPVTDAESMLLANIARAEEALLKIKKEAVASLESASDEVCAIACVSASTRCDWSESCSRRQLLWWVQAEKDSSTAPTLQSVLSDQVDTRGNLVNTDAAVQRARAILAAIQAGNTQLTELAARLAEVVSVVRNDREASALQTEYAAALNSGLPVDHAVAAQAQELLNELSADEAMLQKLVDEVTISRDAEVLDAGIQHARQVRLLHILGFLPSILLWNINRALPTVFVVAWRDVDALALYLLWCLLTSFLVKAIPSS